MVGAVLPAITPTEFVTHAAFEPVALIAAALAITWYVRNVRTANAAGRPWPTRFSVLFGTGIAGFVWTSSGGLAVYASSLFWVWVTQLLLLFLVVPILIVAGRPVQLAQGIHGDRAVLLRIVHSPVGRLVTNPFVAPVLVPVTCAVLFFVPVPGWSIGSPIVGWAVKLAVVALGAMIALPLVAPTTESTSLAIGFALLVGSFELLLDAVPGIVLRLSTNTVTTFDEHRTLRIWSLTPLRDQQIGGAVLWAVAEFIDLPFLVIVFLRWQRADARDAARIDAVLEAERIAFGSGTDDENQAGDDTHPVGDQPWWLTDPSLKHRFDH
jgi:putative membrane protein